MAPRHSASDSSPAMRSYSFLESPATTASSSTSNIRSSRSRTSQGYVRHRCCLASRPLSACRTNAVTGSCKGFSMAAPWGLYSHTSVRLVCLQKTPAGFVRFQRLKTGEIETESGHVAIRGSKKCSGVHQIPSQGSAVPHGGATAI